jgi:hypothetical protein
VDAAGHWGLPQRPADRTLAPQAGRRQRSRRELSTAGKAAGERYQRISLGAAAVEALLVEAQLRRAATLASIVIAGGVVKSCVRVGCLITPRRP